MANDQAFRQGVFSDLVEEDIQIEAQLPSANAIIIFGTAEKGPVNVPTRVKASTVTQTFGRSVNDPYERFGLVKGFEEINGSTPGADIIAVRVGDVKNARLDLYEQQVSSGDFIPQAEDTLSVSLEALDDGNEGNLITADVYGDAQGLPTRMIIGLPNGTSVEFDMLNSYKTPSALALAINNDRDASQYLSATPNVLNKTENVTIVEDDVVSGEIETVYQLSQRNLLDITAVYVSGEIEDNTSIPAGRSSATLANTPIKDTEALTPTINKFWQTVINETILEAATPGDVGETDFNLISAEADPAYNATDPTTRLKNLVIRKKSGSTGLTTILELTTDYSILDGGVPSIQLTSGVAVGDELYADYYYETDYTEANVRSALDIGNPRSYFVAGDTITFGASQRWPVAVTYETKTNFSIPGDVTINGLSGASKGQIRFVLGENAPSITDVITVEYVFEPQLPAPNNPIGTTLPSGKFQNSQLSGGTDGRKIDDLAKFYKSLAKGYLAADNTLFRIAVPQGVYLDDVVLGIDFETGLESVQNAGFHTQLLTFLQRHSQFVSECYGIMSVRPMATENAARPSLDEKDRWVSRLLDVSATDTTRAANVMATIADYHLIVTAGDMLGNSPSIGGGRTYVEGMHNVLAGMKFFHDNMTSIVTRNVPGRVFTRLLYDVQDGDLVSRMNESRYTLFTRDSISGSYKIAAAPTLASATSQFRKQFNVDVTIEAVDEVRAVLRPFIGQPNKASTREAMKQRAKQQLQLLTPDKLMAFEIEVVASQAEAINGKVQVDLRLVTAVEIAQINVRTRISLGV